MKLRLPISDTLKESMLRTFTTEELEKLEAYYDENDKFIGIGFTNQFGIFTKHAEPKKAEVISLLEEKYALETHKATIEDWIGGDIQSKFTEYVRDSVLRGHRPWDIAKDEAEWQARHTSRR